MSDTLTVRHYRPADGPTVERLHEVAMRDTGSYVDADDPDLDVVEESYLAGGEFLVGTLDDEIVAMGAFRPLDDGIAPLFDDLHEPTAELKRMRMAPDHQ